MATANGQTELDCNKMHEDKSQESERIIGVALGEINKGHYEKAIDLLEDAKQLNPESRARELQELVIKLRRNSSGRSSTMEGPERKSDGEPSTCSTETRHRKRHSTSSSPRNNRTDYTKDQLDLVKRINSCSNFYEVLGVAQDAGDSEIKKAYKKLALQLHPDKNRAPGAVDAFKTLGNAMAILIDERKRKEYDLSSNGSPPAYQQYYNNHYHSTSFDASFNEENISAEELFNMFFGSVPSQMYRRPYEAANQRQPQERHQPSLALGLILVLILISTLSSFFTSDPVYNLTQSSKYEVRRETQHLSVPYYVQKSFDKDYRGSLARLDSSVEKDYIFFMKQNCFRERSYREAMMARARSFGNRAQFAQAQGLKMPSCDNLSRIGITRYSLY